MSRVLCPGYHNGLPFGISNASLWDGETYSDWYPWDSNDFVDLEIRYPANSNGSLPCGPGTFAPFKTTFDKFVKYFWKLKKFDYKLTNVKLDWVYGTSDGITTDNFDAQSGEIWSYNTELPGWELTGSPDLLDESQLVAKRHRSGIVYNEQFKLETYGGITGACMDSNGFVYFNPVNSLLNSLGFADLTFPYLAQVRAIRKPVFQGDPPEDVNPAQTYDNPAPKVQALTLKFIDESGEEQETPFYSISQALSWDSTMGTWPDYFGTIEIRPSSANNSYWTYEGLYNPDTGERTG